MTALPPTIDKAIELVLRSHEPSEAVSVLQAKGWKFDHDLLAERVRRVADDLRPKTAPPSARTTTHRTPAFVRPTPRLWQGLDVSVLPKSITDLLEKTPSAFVAPTGMEPKTAGEVHGFDEAWRECLGDMLEALNDEIAAADERLLDGRAHASRGAVLGQSQKGFTVSYELDRDLGLADGSQVQLNVDGRALDAEVITVAGETVQLWVRTELPPSPTATIVSDASFLLSLRRRFLADCESTGLDLAGALSRLRSTDTARSVSPLTQDSSVLTDDQRMFVTEALSNDLTWLWGPPGTGKTTALAHLLTALSAGGKRVLFVSNTNAAVDTALLKYAALSPTYALGDVVRLGEPALQEVAELPTPVAVDRISSVRGDPIARALVDCKREIATLRKKNVEQLALIEPTRRDAAPAGVVSPDDLDIARRRDRHFEASHAIAPEVGFLIERRTTLEELMSRLHSAVVDMARIAFATVHRCYLRSLQGQRFDYVIIDEASMVSTDLTLIASAMSSSGVVVAGDFRQLGPIALAESPSAHRWLRQSIFEEVGITGEVSTGRLRPGLVALREQHRMRPPIESLIGTQFYPEIALKGSAHIATRTRTGLTDLPTAELLLFDTSALHPWMGRRAGRWSRLNPMHAQVAAELLHHLPPDTSFGMVSPFAAQARLLKALLGRDDAQRSASTVHRFQGGERDVMLWDTTLGAAGQTRTNPWFLATRPHEEGFRLMNVALSRARDQLGILADLKHLAKELHESTTARRALAFVERHGEPVNLQELLVSGRTTRLGRGRASGDPLVRLVDESSGPVVIWTTEAPKEIADELHQSLERARARGTAVYLRCQVPTTPERAAVIRDLQARGVSVRYLPRVTEHLAVGSAVLSSPYSLLTMADQQVWLRTESAPLAQALLRLLKRTADPAFADGEPDPTCPRGHPTVLTRGKEHDYVPQLCPLCQPATLPRTGVLTR